MKLLDVVSRYWWVLLVRGLAATVFGVVAVVWPGITVGALVIVFGAYAIMDGIADLAMAIRGGGETRLVLSGGDRVWLVLMGVLGIGAGLVAFIWPGITAVALLWVIAFWALVKGVVELLAAWRLRAELTNEWMWVLSGLFSLALGIALLVQPTAGVLALILWVGILAIAWGVALCILAFRVRGMADQPTVAPA